MDPNEREGWTKIVTAEDIDYHMDEIGQAETNAHLVAEMFGEFPLDKWSRLLVPGCGTGQMFDYIRPADIGNLEFTFTDLNPRFLLKLRERIPRYMCTNYIIADDIDKYLSELLAMASGSDSNLLVLYDGETPIGYIGLRYFESPLGNQRIANENYLYVLPEKRGLASMRLIRNAKFLAKHKGCSHLILNASNLASELHDKVCRVYEKMGLVKFETSFIVELKESRGVSSDVSAEVLKARV